ncbi:uncharacterized protein F5147DRAFT_727201 [Suillus discolor]|uniref:Secreted protein n=1 Tax=Suillus discolor TaxID=1912936 RepID=A0A9P7ES96_9AGAM|nr:uncharacterized protein F5147DRAFT_727201 [Suillus discolor]KAG2088072.1 hypothetical protein F5147DRAFT_727201 [Suillus discolor]
MTGWPYVPMGFLLAAIPAPIVTSFPLESPSFSGRSASSCRANESTSSSPNRTFSFEWALMIVKLHSPPVTTTSYERVKSCGVLP